MSKLINNKWSLADQRKFLTVTLDKISTLGEDSTLSAATTSCLEKSFYRCLPTSSRQYQRPTCHSYGNGNFRRNLPHNYQRGFPATLEARHMRFLSSLLPNTRSRHFFKPLSQRAARPPQEKNHPPSNTCNRRRAAKTSALISFKSD